MTTSWLQFWLQFGGFALCHYSPYDQVRTNMNPHDLVDI